MIYDNNKTIFLLTFSSSVFTAAFGIAKYLKLGPCRLIPNVGPPLGGYCQIGFLLIMVNVASTILSKGFTLPPLGSGPGTRLFHRIGDYIGSQGSDKMHAVYVWFFICYVPNLTFVSKDI